eukprot:6042952-Pyramimonas_sp.AAC.1
MLRAAPVVRAADPGPRPRQAAAVQGSLAAEHQMRLVLDLPEATGVVAADCDGPLAVIAVHPDDVSLRPPGAARSTRGAASYGGCTFAGVCGALTKRRAQ